MTRNVWISGSTADAAQWFEWSSALRQRIQPAPEGFDFTLMHDCGHWFLRSAQRLLLRLREWQALAPTASQRTRWERLLAEQELVRVNAAIAEARRERANARRAQRQGVQLQAQRLAAQAAWAPDELAFVSERARVQLAACGIDSLAALLSHTGPWYGAMIGWRELASLEACLRVRGLRLPRREHS